MWVGTAEKVFKVTESKVKVTERQLWKFCEPLKELNENLSNTYYSRETNWLLFQGRGVNSKHQRSRLDSDDHRNSLHLGDELFRFFKIMRSKVKVTELRPWKSNIKQPLLTIDWLFTNEQYLHTMAVRTTRFYTGRSTPLCCVNIAEWVMVVDARDLIWLIDHHLTLYLHCLKDIQGKGHRVTAVKSCFALYSCSLVGHWSLEMRNSEVNKPQQAAERCVAVYTNMPVQRATRTRSYRLSKCVKYSTGTLRDNRGKGILLWKFAFCHKF